MSGPLRTWAGTPFAPSPCSSKCPGPAVGPLTPLTVWTETLLTNTNTDMTASQQGDTNSEGQCVGSYERLFTSERISVYQHNDCLTCGPFSFLVRAHSMHLYSLVLTVTGNLNLPTGVERHRGLRSRHANTSMDTVTMQTTWWQAGVGVLAYELTD